jgi:hypothetical protein
MSVDTTLRRSRTGAKRPATKCRRQTIDGKAYVGVRTGMSDQHQWNLSTP